MSSIARHLKIHGRVQGVFYRNWTKNKADELGLTGWVRNRLDGSVEAWIEGPEESVQQFIAFAHSGPPAASVTQMDVDSVQPEKLSSFEKRPTA